MQVDHPEPEKELLSHGAQPLSLLEEHFAAEEGPEEEKKHAW